MKVILQLQITVRTKESLRRIGHGVITKDSGLCQRERVVVAAIEWQVIEFLRVDHTAYSSCLGFKQWRTGFNLYLGCDGAYSELKVDLGAGLYVYRDILAHACREARLRSLNGVVAWDKLERTAAVNYVPAENREKVNVP